MPIVLKTRREIELMRAAGKLAHDILMRMADILKPGVTTKQLDDIAEEELYRANAVGLSKNYPTYKAGEGFPASTCISVNEEIVHGIPTHKRVLKEGDIVTSTSRPSSTATAPIWRSRCRSARSGRRSSGCST